MLQSDGSVLMKSCDDQVEVVRPKWRRDDDDDHIATGAVRGDDDNNSEYSRAVCLVRAIADDVVGGGWSCVVEMWYCWMDVVGGCNGEEEVRAVDYLKKEGESCNHNFQLARSALIATSG